MHRIDALQLEHPFAGSRKLRDLLRAEGVMIGRLAVANKHPPNAIEDATESAATVQARLDNMCGRGLDPSFCRLVRRLCCTVKHWRDAAMALRWTGAALLEAANTKGFRRLKAHHRLLPILKASLAAHGARHTI
jgi:hypothetical protein